ncbi:MAG: hypothetical protein ABI843_12350 [Dokdonella sp.]
MLHEIDQAIDRADRQAFRNITPSKLSRKRVEQKVAKCVDNMGHGASLPGSIENEVVEPARRMAACRRGLRFGGAAADVVWAIHGPQPDWREGHRFAMSASLASLVMTLDLPSQ